MKATFKLWRLLNYLIFAGCSLLFSCADHVVPNEPEVSSCNRIDGSPRFYPCEFEIVKIETLKNATEVRSTATKEHPYLTVSFAEGQKNYGSGHQTSGFAYFPATITLRRIANPAFPVPDGYWLQHYTEDLDDKFYVGFFSGAAPINVNLKMGETGTYQTYITLEFGGVPLDNCEKCVGENRIMVMKNPKTEAALAADPHKYLLLRDRSEANLLVNIKMIP